MKMWNVYRGTEGLADEQTTTSDHEGGLEIST